MFNFKQTKMMIANNINQIVPEKIRAFVKAVSTVPAPNFDPFICADSVDIQVFESCYSVVFSGLQKPVIWALIYPWIPKGFRCSGVTWTDTILTVDMQNAQINTHGTFLPEKSS